MEKTIPPVIEGSLVKGNDTIRVKTRYASKFSLWIDVDGDRNGEEFDNLILTIAGNDIEIGPCRVLPDARADGGHKTSRLIAVGRIHNFEQLFFHSKIDTLESASMNISLILGYKNKIDPSFKEYVSGLTYDLSVFASLFDHFDSEAREEPMEVWEPIQESIIEDIGKNLTEYMDERYAELKKLVSAFTEKEHEHHGFYFRKQLWNIILRSPFMARTNLKPRGYNGDSEMMRMIYRNSFQGDSTFGKIIHKYSMDQPAAQAVRNRREEIPRLVERYRKEHGILPPEKMRILSVACGPALEVADILRTPEDCDSLHFSMLDQDPQALLEASTLIDGIETSMKREISTDFIRESVRTMLLPQELEERWGQFHFIYSMGLFDYLTAPVATAVLKKLYALLKPDGEMVIGNMYMDNFSRYFMEYWHDWRIILRSEEEFMQLARDLPRAAMSVFFDATGIQMLLHLKKRAFDV